jgi:hypothetical protein
MLRPVLDRLSLIAIACVAYAIANIAHEGLGHGGACRAVGGRPVAVSAVHFEGDVEGLPPSARRWQAAGGSLLNLALGLTCLAPLRRRTAATPARYFLWLLGTLNLLQAFGYGLFSGIGGIGDWAVVVRGFEPAWAWRVGLALLGGVGYWMTIALSLRLLLTFIGDAPGRIARAVTLTLVPYVAGGILYVAAGLLNPHGLRLVAISAAAASFGGASAFAWMAQLLRDTRAYPPSPEPALALRPSLGWRLAGILVAAVFILVLGPSIPL